MSVQTVPVLSVQKVKRHWQLPPRQVSPAWQGIPHPPQLLESLSGSTQLVSAPLPQAMSGAAQSIPKYSCVSYGIAGEAIRREK